MLRVTRGPNCTLFFNQGSWAKNSLSSLPGSQIWQKQRWATKQTARRCCYPLVLFLEASHWCCSSDCKMVSVAWQVKKQHSEPNHRISSILGKWNTGPSTETFCTHGDWIRPVQPQHAVLLWHQLLHLSRCNKICSNVHHHYRNLKFGLGPRSLWRSTLWMLLDCPIMVSLPLLVMAMLKWSV